MNLICRTKGHMVACRQDATLFPEGGGLLYHMHQCLRCTRTLHTFPTEPLPSEIESLLRMTAPPTDGLMNVDIHPSYAHKNNPLVH